MTSQLICSGALIYAINSKRLLFLHRANCNNSDYWGLVGGKNEKEETPWQGLQREIKEEIGDTSITKAIPLETFISPNNYFLFHTYLCVVDKEFIPTLNHEHNGYTWVEFNVWPKPLLPGLRNTLAKKVNREKLHIVFETIDLLMANKN